MEQLKRSKRNIPSTEQVFLQSLLTYLSYLTTTMTPITSGFGPLCCLPCSNQVFICLLSSPTDFCSESAQLCSPKPVTGVNRSKCNFPEQEGGEKLNAAYSQCLVLTLPFPFRNSTSVLLNHEGKIYAGVKRWNILKVRGTDCTWQKALGNQLFFPSLHLAPAATLDRTVPGCSFVVSP